LTANLQAAEVLVTVSDSGIGIPAHSLPTIFEIFSQVDRALERTTGGLGIGPALVRAWLKCMEGRSFQLGSKRTMQMLVVEAQTSSIGTPLRRKFCSPRPVSMLSLRAMSRVSWSSQLSRILKASIRRQMRLMSSANTSRQPQALLVRRRFAVRLEISPCRQRCIGPGTLNALPQTFH
jgi:hypothetical protein